MKKEVILDLDMNKKIDILTIPEFSTAIKLALKRGGVDDFNVLLEWYLENTLIDNLKKIRGIGKKRIEIIDITCFIYLVV